MKSFEEKLKDFAIELYKINAIKFGNFQTKVGLMTPVYCDLRVIVSFPETMDRLTDLLIHRLQNIASYNLICGVPYTALPIATCISVKTKKPMVMRRKEAKDYGTKKLIEGTFKKGDTCLIVEDVVTSGSSILETIKDLKDVGIVATDAIILLNREQGGAKILKENGVDMHALLTMTQLIAFLEEEKCITHDTTNEVHKYLKENQVQSMLNKPAINRLKMSFEERSKQSTCPIATRLFKLMCEKQSNLCVAADLTLATDILNLAEEVGPHICLFKTHIDIVEDFHENFIKRLREIADQHKFILFEDRKFADIGKTVQLQYSEGIYHISSWASLVTCHSITGKGVLDAIQQSRPSEENGVFLLAETSASGNLIDANFTKATINLAKQFPQLVAGFVCQNPLFLDQPAFIQLTPGVSFLDKTDNLGQNYNTPEDVVNNGADVAVVGRSITKAKHQGDTARSYQKTLWQAYLNRIK